MRKELIKFCKVRVSTAAVTGNDAVTEVCKI